MAALPIVATRGRGGLAIRPRYKPKVDPARLLATFFDKYSALTRRAYEADLRDFAGFLGGVGSRDAAAWFLGLGQGEANQTILDYVAALKGQGRSAATINRRLATLKSLTKIGRTLGASALTIEIHGEPATPYVDTAGPPIGRIRKMFADLGREAAANNRRAVRDLAIARLLYGQGLRKFEITGLDLRHLDRERGRLSIRGKRRSRREWVTLAPKVLAALEDWIAVRGEISGPLFVRVSSLRAAVRPRLCGRQINRIVGRWKIKPHGLRHAAVTNALEATGGDVPKVQRFARHSSPSTTLIYDDRRQDMGGQVARLLDELEDEPLPEPAPVLNLSGLTEVQARRVKATLAGAPLAEVAEAEGVSSATVREAITQALPKVPGLHDALVAAGRALRRP